MSAGGGVVFLLDVDNTLLDNDSIEADLRRHLEQRIGTRCAEDYWRIFEELRGELGYADYLGALQRYRLDRLHDPRILEMSSFLIDYPFADRLYPGALEAIAWLNGYGTTVILSDGDVVFQPHKVQRSGLWQAVEGRVLIYIHKEQELIHVEHRYPARQYVLVDDKRRILAAVKQAWGPRVLTVWPKQGHYALDSAQSERYPEADVTIERIEQLRGFPVTTLAGG